LVLEGNSQEFTKLQALRVLVHLTGDIHQPLHVGTGYFTVNNANTITLITDPIQAKGKPNDVGGNDLFFGPGMFDELHGLWDGKLVEDVDHTTTFHKLAPFLTNKIDKEHWTMTGDHHQWAEAWASDSVKEALASYQGIKFSAPQFSTHHDLRKIQIALPDHYEETKAKIVEKQLAKAGFHLAQLLNGIKWPTN